MFYLDTTIAGYIAPITCLSWVRAQPNEDLGSFRDASAVHETPTCHL